MAVESTGTPPKQSPYVSVMVNVVWIGAFALATASMMGVEQLGPAAIVFAIYAAANCGYSK